MTDHQFSHLWSESRPRTACPGPARSKTPPAGVRAARPRRFHLQPWFPLKSGVRKVLVRRDSFCQKRQSVPIGFSSTPSRFEPKLSYPPSLSPPPNRGAGAATAAPPRPPTRSGGVSDRAGHGHAARGRDSNHKWLNWWSAITMIFQDPHPASLDAIQRRTLCHHRRRATRACSTPSAGIRVRLPRPRSASARSRFVSSRRRAPRAQDRGCLRSAGPHSARPTRTPGTRGRIEPSGLFSGAASPLLRVPVGRGPCRAPLLVAEDPPPE